LLLHSAQPRVQIHIHVALALLRVVDVVGQHFDLAAQPVQIGIEPFHAVEQLHNAAIGALGLDLGEFLPGDFLFLAESLHLTRINENRSCSS